MWIIIGWNVMKFGTDILGSQRRNRSIHTPFIHPIIFLCLSNSGGGRLCCTRVGSLNHVAWDHYKKRKTASGKLKWWKTACEVSIFIKWNLIYCLDSYLKHNEKFFFYSMKVTILDNSSIGGHSFWTTFQASHYVLRPVVFLRTHSLLSPFSDCFQLLQHDGATYIIFHIVL